MSDFTSTMTDSTAIDQSVLTAWNEATLFEAGYENVAAQLATIKVNKGAATIYFPRFANMTPVYSALTANADPSSTQITDTGLTIAPLEFGDVVTTTKKANLASGGRLDMAAAKVVGVHMGSSIDKIATVALEAFSTDVIYPNAKTAVGDLTEGDVLDGTFASRLYNRLARKNIPTIGGSYFGLAHDDLLHDLRQDAGAGNWTDVSQYSNITGVLNCEVGLYKGIRWLRSKNMTISADGGAGTVASYKVAVVGANALGYGVSEEPHIVISGPFDKLLRYVNVGWYGVFAFGVVDTDNMVLGNVASSVGANT